MECLILEIFINLILIFITILMKILFSHLKKYLKEDIDISSISKTLFQLGHENQYCNDVLDIEFTPNKGDCLSVFGLARD